jgi:hypothetical protein
MILCECGGFIDGCTFKDYIKTSSNPSTSTIGHTNCGCIFNFIDEGLPKKFSTKIELKSMAMKLAEKNEINYELTEKLLVEVDRLKSGGRFSDGQILVTAYRNVVMKRSEY